MERWTQGGVTLITGDCLSVMAGMEAESVDAVVTDPPYGLEFMGKEWDKLLVKDRHVDYPSCRKSHGPNAYLAGKQAQEWHQRWAEAVLRVLKPGGHMLVAGIGRTHHRMMVGVEDARFEIRDCIYHLFGSGFPKSLDVSKAIDKRGGAEIAWFGPWLRQEREGRGITQKELARHFLSKTGGLTGCVANWELGLNMPTVEQFNELCDVLDLPFERLEEAEREVVGNDRSGPASVAFARQAATEFNVTAPATDAARRWQGWGTALKPAAEVWVLARKPLSGTVAENVLAHGTGALNVAATRVRTEAQAPDADACMQPSLGDGSGGIGDSSLSHVLGVLHGIASELRSYSNDSKGHEHDGAGLDGSSLVAGRYDGTLLPRLYPNGAWCGLSVSGVQGSQGDCRPCRRFCDEQFRQVQEAAEESAPSLADALAHIGQGLLGFGHSRECRCSGHPSNYGALRRIVALLDLLGYTIPHSAPPCNEGRWPPNVVLDEDAAAMLDAQSGERPGRGDYRSECETPSAFTGQRDGFNYADSGGASRFFYVAKASRSERGNGNLHPTVKPLALMKWLVTLVTPPGGLVLDPFLGSGTTALACQELGFRCVGIELNPEYVEIAKKRLGQQVMNF